MIVIDGMNAAIRHGHDKRFSSKGLRIAIEFWIQKKHTVLVLLPDFCFNKEDAIKR
jgi:ribonuclease ZC3H12